MSLADFLPGVSKAFWTDYVRAIEPTKPLIIPAGARNVHLVPSNIIDQRGIFLEFVMNANTPDIEFIVILDNRRIHVTIKQVYELGYVGYFFPNTPFISEYNPTNNVYVVNLVGEIPLKHNMNILVYIL